MAYANITKAQADKLRKATSALYVESIITRQRYLIIKAKIRDEAEKRER